MIRRPPRSTQSRSSAASDVYKRQPQRHPASGNARHGQRKSRPTAPQENTSSIDTATLPFLPTPITLQPDVRQNPFIHSYNAVPPSTPGGGIQVFKRTRRRALASPWDRKVHSQTLTTTTLHTRTNIPHVERTMRLVDLATEIGGTSTSPASLARRLGTLADSTNRQLRIPCTTSQTPVPPPSSIGWAHSSARAALRRHYARSLFFCPLEVLRCCNDQWSPLGPTSAVPSHHS